MNDYDEESEESSEMGHVRSDEWQKATQELMKHFGAGVPKEVLAECCKNMAIQLSQKLSNTIESSIRKQIETECGKEALRLARDQMPKIFASVLEKEIIVTGDSWNQQKCSIQDIVKNEMGKALAKFQSQRDRQDLIKEAINSFMTKEVADTAKNAVEEFKAELLRDLGKEGMKQIVKAVASTLAGDKKLLTLLSN